MPADTTALTVHVSREEILHDIYLLMKDMSSIRRRSINGIEISEPDKKTYMELTSLLSKAFLGISDQQTLSRLEALVTFMNHEEKLLEYDPVQRRYWQKHNPEFVRTVDLLLIQLYGDDFNSLDKAHHLMCALKYACAANEEEDERAKILETILPVNGPVMTDDRTMQFYAEHLSRRDNPAKLTLDLSSIAEVVRNLIVTARDLGYISITLTLDRESYIQIAYKFRELIPRNVRKRGGSRHVTVEIPVNPLPKDYDNVTGRIKSFLENKELFEIVQYDASLAASLMFGYNAEKVKEYIRKGMEGILPFVNHSAISTEGSALEYLARYRTVLQEVSSRPERYGFLPGDKVIGNRRIAEMDDADEEFWTGSEGVIERIDTDSLIVMFDRPKFKDKKKKAEVAYEVIDNPDVLTRVGAKRNYPEWYIRRTFEIEETVRLNKEWEDYDYLEEGELDVGSVGVVLGPTYTVRFSKIVPKKGMPETLHGNEQATSDVVHHCIDRQEVMDELTIETRVRDIFTNALNKAYKEFDTVPIETAGSRAQAYFHNDVIGTYSKTTLLVNGDGNRRFVICYITETDDTPKARKRFTWLRSSNSSISPSDIADFMHAYRGATSEAFRQVAETLQPIYLSLYEYKGTDLMNFLEATR